ncbi:MAG: phosphotransferase family protein [Pseudomonadota bacterium]|nr:phosphotransferase family protein [Pseudomonadota bacterium]
MTEIDLESRVRSLPCWSGPVSLGALQGGLSNTSFLVTDGARKYVARCGGDIAVHHVFRDRERAISEAAFRAGLSPELVHAQPGIMVFDFIAGRTFTEQDMRANVDRILPLVQTCHREVGRIVRGPANLFWVFHVIRDYAQTLARGKSRFAADLARFAKLADALENRQIALPIVLGHHDLLPGNFLDDGDRLWLIDWEYGGFGTPLFDLANIAANGSFSEAEEIRLLEGYFGRSTSGELSRSFDAMKAASALREAMWAMVSELHLSVPGADYAAHAEEYLRRTDAAVAVCEDRHGSL